MDWLVYGCRTDHAAEVVEVIWRRGDGLAALVDNLPDPSALDWAGEVAVLSADEVDDRLRGFSEGIDDYLVKPFSMAELVARVTAVLRRRGRVPSVIEVGDLLVDQEAASARRGDTVLDLTATEFRLLEFLAVSRGRTLSKGQILTQVWGYDDYDPNLVEVHLSSLRRKMELHGPRLIHTVRGMGYRVAVAEAVR